MREEKETWYFQQNLSIEVLISKALIDSVISHDEFVLINIVLEVYEKMKEKMENLKSKKT